MERLADAILGAIKAAKASKLDPPPMTNHSRTLLVYCREMASAKGIDVDRMAFLRLWSELSRISRHPMSLRGAWDLVTVHEVMTS